MAQRQLGEFEELLDSDPGQAQRFDDRPRPEPVGLGGGDVGQAVPIDSEQGHAWRRSNDPGAQQTRTVPLVAAWRRLMELELRTVNDEPLPVVGLLCRREQAGRPVMMVNTAYAASLRPMRGRPQHTEPREEAVIHRGCGFETSHGRPATMRGLTLSTSPRPAHETGDSPTCAGRARWISTTPAARAPPQPTRPLRGSGNLLRCASRAPSTASVKYNVRCAPTTGRAAGPDLLDLPPGQRGSTPLADREPSMAVTTSGVRTPTVPTMTPRTRRRTAPICPTMPGAPVRARHDHNRVSTFGVPKHSTSPPAPVIGSLDARHRTIGPKQFHATIDREVPAGYDYSSYRQRCFDPGGISP